MATGYVSNWGNDENDGLTWETAKRTHQGAEDESHSPIEVKGWHNEDFNSSLVFKIGYKTIISGENISSTLFTALQNAKFSDYIFSNWLIMCRQYFPRTYNDLDKCNLNRNGIIGYTQYNNIDHGSNGIAKVQNCLFYENTRVDIGFGNESTLYFRNNTLHNNVIIYVIGDNTLLADYEKKNNIISNCEIGWRTRKTPSYSLFINSKFQFVNGGLGFDEAIFEYPTGATDTNKLQNLRDRMAIVYGGVATNYFIGCKYYSGSYTDIFVDADNGDFNLVPFCIAANMNYVGDYVGARPEGIKANWNTDFNNIINIGTPGFILDQNINSTTNSDIIDIGHVRTILNFQVLGNMASRNGQQINTESNLSSNIYEGASVLTDGSVYMCVDDTIELDDGGATPRIPWETFVAVDEGGGAGLGFSTDGVGVVREVYIDDRYTEKIQLKSSKTDPTLAVATTITSFLHSDPVLVNVDVGGEPTHGDADVGYTEGTAVPLTSRYIKFYIKIKAWNLPARV